MVSIIIAFIFAAAEGFQKPEPRLVYPRLLEERSPEGRMVMRVHDDLTLNLRKASVAAPKLRVLTEEDGVTVTRFYDGADIEKYLYEDEEKIATVHVTSSEHGLEMRGVVGPRHRIAPMLTSERSEGGVVPHIIHEIEEEEMFDKSVNLESKDHKRMITERQNLGSYAGPPVVSVEVFIVTDERHHRYFVRTELALSYLCVLVNSANLRFSATTLPRLRLVLTGMEKIEGRKFDPVSNEEYLFDEGAIKGFKLYAVGKRQAFGRPDVVYLLSGRDVITIVEGKYSTRGLGIGYVGGVCTDAYVALGEDKPGLYTGMQTFTHELAHTLGATHDGSDPASNIPGHPSAKSCDWDVGNIMSYKNVGRSHHYFSQCSLLQIQFVLRLRGQTCWAFAGTEHTLEGVYPGMKVSFQAFCTNVFPDQKNVTVDFVNKTNCKVRCKYEKYHSYDYYGRTRLYTRVFYMDTDALDYMQCDENMVCIRGDCVDYKPIPRITTTTKAPPTTKTSPETVTHETGIQTTDCRCDCSSTARTTPTRKTAGGNGRYSSRFRYNQG
ncbi:venom metalloproteinase BumaMPs1-like [Haemaphysalis longicornis]